MKKKLFILIFFIAFFQIKSSNSQNLIPFRQGDKWGYVNKEKNIIIQPQFDDAYMFREGIARVFKGNKFGFIDTKGNLIGDFKYEDPNLEKGYATDGFYFSEGLMPICKANKWGFINNQGKEIIACTYDWVFNFSNRLARVQIKNKFGFINLLGKWVIEPIYDDASDFIDGWASVEINGKYGIIDTLGKTIIPFEYDYIGEPKRENGVIAVMKKKFIACGFINAKNETIIPFNYRNSASFQNGLAKVYSEGNWKYIDTLGNEVIKGGFKLANNFKDGLAIVANEELLYGIIDKQGNTIIPQKYDLIGKGILRKHNDNLIIGLPLKIEKYFYESYQEGLIPLYLDGKAGVANYMGEIVIPFQYDYVSCFENGLAIVIKNNKYGYIDKSGVEYFED